VPSSFNLLLLDSVLNNLGVDELLKLLLLRDLKVIFVSVGLGWYGVVSRSHRLAVDDGYGEVSGTFDQLGLLIVCSLVRGGVQDWSYWLTVDHWCRKISRCSGSTEWIVRTSSSRESCRKLKLRTS
jgi:hypothetical protein